MKQFSDLFKMLLDVHKEYSQFWEMMKEVEIMIS